ncbi:MAG: stimulus-sensing domain-containing protein [Hyphomicrobiaceae bacterium]
MAIETDGKATGFAAGLVTRIHAGYTAARQALGRALRPVRDGQARIAAVAGPVLEPVARFFRNASLSRFIGRTLLRRIIASNLLGLGVLLMGLTWLIQFNSWLIDAKIDHLRAQSHILAAAIASKASLDSEEGASGGDSLRDNPFAALEFSIQPEIVVPLLPSLLEKTTNRARVYDVNGVLIADSSQILRPENIIPLEPNGTPPGRKPKTENIFTRMLQWLMITSDLRVYKEIGRANGRFYPEVEQALDGKTTALMMLARRRQKIVSVATPIVRGDKVRGVLLLSTAPGAVDDVQADELFAVFVLVLGAAAAAVLASYLLARTVAEPVRQLSQYANEVTNDIQAAEELPRFDEREDEVGQLSRSFALMTRALFRRIEASEKFAADVAHELKNPLTAARSTAESLIYVKTDQQRDEFIEQIQLELKRLNKLISDVADASRLDADLALQRFEPVHLEAVAESVVATFRDLADDDNKRIKLAIAASNQRNAYLVLGQDGRIEQVLTNLLSNALSFTPDGGTVTVRMRRQQQVVDLIVEDQGPGIDPENIEKIFTRFYTYRPTGNSSRGGNSGLGLAISREIVEAHAGQIWAENILPAAASDAEAPLGARFVVRLPAKDGAAPATGSRLTGGR